MVAIKKMPKEALAELIGFIADHEPFCSVETKLDGAMKVNEVRDALRELAFELKREAASELDGSSDANKVVSKKTKDILSCLSTYEEKRLLKAFGFEEA